MDKVVKRIPYALVTIISLGMITFGVAFTTKSFATGPLINDVGNGALVWGTSSERTTYLGPYYGPATPRINRLYEDGEVSASRDNSSADSERWKKENEVGVVIGTDGKLYRYHYVRGTQPHRVVESRLVNGRWENVPKTIWETVLIRVLEPADAPLKSKDNISASSANLGNADPSRTPAPCEPNANLAGSERASNAASGNAAASSATNPAADPAVAPSLDPRANADNTVNTSNQPPAPWDGSITVSVTTYDSKATGARQPIYLTQPYAPSRQ